jgi:hypothetical protein
MPLTDHGTTDISLTHVQRYSPMRRRKSSIGMQHPSPTTGPEATTTRKKAQRINHQPGRRTKMAKAKRKIKKDISIGALSKAKSVYAENGDSNSCGDWLAQALKEHCHRRTASTSASLSVCSRRMTLSGTSTGKLTAGLEGSV